MGASRLFATANLDIGTVSALNTLFNSGGTLLAWAYPTATGGSTGGRIVHSGILGSTGYAFYTRSATGSRIAFAMNFSVTTGLWYATTTISLNTWSHFAVTYNSSSSANNPTFYINGVSSATTTATVPNGTKVNSTTNIYIGDSDAANRPFSGNLCYISAYSSVLSNNQIIESMYKPGKVLGSSFQGYWPILGSFSPELDLSGKGHNATVNGPTEAFDGPRVIKV